MAKVFNNVGNLHPGRSVFDLSYRKKMTCDMGQLIPIMCDEMVPGDNFSVGTETVIRFQPLVAPILHEVNAYVHYFFVPYRLLWDQWEDFITGGVDGDIDLTPPEWTSPTTTKGGLWDYFGFPTGVTPTGRLPLDFPRRAYNFIYNEYYRDENLIDEVALTNQDILYRCWEKDYFTSSLPWQQRGVAPAFPISGVLPLSGSASWAASMFGNTTTGIPNAQGFKNTGADGKYYGADAQTEANAKTFFAANTLNGSVDLSGAATFNVSDLRLAVQIQKWLERNARAGARYVEFLTAHFGVSPKDARLQRPEYVGGAKTPVIISEVLQTGSTDATSPQGNMAGHGITADSQFSGSYHAEEFGLMMGILSVMPRTAYQQGIDKQWLRKSRYDFYFPEFANLSEQAIETVEIYATAVEAENKTIFGYQGRFDEMRIKRDMVVADMRDSFDYWHLGRKFTSIPSLNGDFVKCIPSKRIFAVPSEPGLIAQVGNIIRASRPMPIMSNPGLLDHD